MSCRLSSLAALASAILIALSASPVWAVQANVSFAGSYAGEMDSFGDGSVTYKSGSGVTNYLRATAAADAVTPSLVLVSLRQGRMTSSPSIHYTGPTGGSVTVRLHGSFTRSISGGFGLANGVAYEHQLAFALRDQASAQDVRLWTIADEEILCGVLVAPTAVGGCNGFQSETYPANWTKTASGSGIINGHNYVLRVYVASIIKAWGVAPGLRAVTTAQEMSGSISW